MIDNTKSSLMRAAAAHTPRMPDDKDANHTTMRGATHVPSELMRHKPHISAPFLTQMPLFPAGLFLAPEHFIRPRPRALRGGKEMAAFSMRRLSKPAPPLLPISRARWDCRKRACAAARCGTNTAALPQADDNARRHE